MIPCTACARPFIPSGPSDSCALCKTLCFDCHRLAAENRYASLVVLLEAGGEASTDPRRLRDGTADFNLGLPPVVTQVGTRPDGKPKLRQRPISVNEMGTNRKRKEYAKRHGLVPVEKAYTAAKGAIR